MQTIKSQLDTRSEDYQKNREDMIDMLDYLDELFVEVAEGGGEEAMERLRSRNKLPVRQRISLVLDRDSPFMEISPLAGWNSGITAVGSGFIVGIGVISDVECLILGHDPSVRAGAFNAFNAKKLMRGLQISRENRIPYVQFVESAGGDLRGNPSGGNGGGEDDKDKDPRKPALRSGTFHFAETGRLFYEITELSQMRIPTISVVFGTSTAGGAYQPGMSDYNIFIKKQSKVFLGGPPLVKMATGEDADDESLGGAEMHTQTSGLGDYLAEDEYDGARMCREVVSHLNWRKWGPGPTLPADEPIYDPDELLGIVSKDLKGSFDIREVIARIVDGSRFEDFKPLYGPTLVCGWASIDGYPIGILGNNGALFSESAEKASQFIQLCNQIDVPLLFLHNITGYIVGTDFEQGGITKNGSKMINAVSNSTVPHVTVIVGASYGAGNYGMSGRSFGPRFTFIWPTAKIAVMGPKQMAGVMSIVTRNSAKRRGLPFDEEADAKRAAAVEESAEIGSLGLYATAAISDDGMIDPRDTRKYISMVLSVCHNKKIEGAKGYGVWRM
ncbi:MAG: acyl-CoA carboxylase subunit beta [Deltaproteobacteria bacterium]|nr:acyl-CoA carboxylase subunit beta [Deltaproteobacteria bacterium]